MSLNLSSFLTISMNLFKFCYEDEILILIPSLLNTISPIKSYFFPYSESIFYKSVNSYS